MATAPHRFEERSRAHVASLELQCLGTMSTHVCQAVIPPPTHTHEPFSLRLRAYIREAVDPVMSWLVHNDNHSCIMNGSYSGGGCVISHANIGSFQGRLTARMAA